MLPTYYNTGTASVDNGATTITFVGALLGTAEAPNIQAGDLFFDPAQPLVPGQRIASVNYDDGEAELWVAWPGTSMTADPYEVRYADDIARSTAQTRRVLEQLGLGALLPEGGTTDQVLKKVSDDDFDMEWADDEGAATAADVAFTPVGGLAATDVQAAIAELDTEKQAASTDLADLVARWVPASASGPASLDFHEDTDSAGGNRGRLTVPAALGADRNYVLPDADFTMSAFMAGLLASASGAALQIAAGIREKLTANRTYYVRPDGSDVNPGTANISGGAFLTGQKAWDTVAALDLSIYSVTIKYATGTYTGGINMTAMPVGGASITIEGDTGTPANVHLNRTATCFTVNAPAPCPIAIRGFKLTFAGSGASAVHLSAPSIVTVSNIELAGGSTGFGGAYSAAIAGAQLIISTGQLISGGMSALASAQDGGLVRFFGITVTLTGTPAFSWVTVSAGFGGLVSVAGVTFSGAATGIRYNAQNAGGISTGGGGASFIPGNSAGSATSPAWYN